MIRHKRIAFGIWELIGIIKSHTIGCVMRPCCPSGRRCFCCPFHNICPIHEFITWQTIACNIRMTIESILHIMVHFARRIPVRDGFSAGFILLFHDFTEIIAAMIHAPNLICSRTYDEFFGIPQTTAKELFIAAIQGKRPYFQAVGLCFVINIATATDRRIDAIVQNQDRSPPMPTA